MSYRIYLAAPWISRGDMEDIAVKFEAMGHKITHKWWNVESRPEAQENSEFLAKCAINDLLGVLSADALVLLNASKSEGKAVEQGVALSNGLPIIAIGKRGDGTSKNVFHYLEPYHWVDSVKQALEQFEAIMEGWYGRSTEAAS